MKSFFIHHMGKTLNAIRSGWRYFFRSSGGVVSPLAAGRSPTDDVLVFGVVVFIGLSSFNRLGKVHRFCSVDSVGSARFSFFSDVLEWVYLGLGIVAIFC